MPHFADLTVSQFLEAVSSPNPTPGGGTASAVAAAMGTALLIMVSGLARSRTNTDEEKAALADIRTTLVGVRDRLVRLADADSDAFDQVMNAYRLPKASDDEKARRKQAVQAALRTASQTPLDVLDAAGDALAAARTVAAHGNRSAVSDIRVALELLEAASSGAAANVEVNIVSLDDETFRKTMADAIVDLTNTITEDAAAARAALAPAAG